MEPRRFDDLIKQLSTASLTRSQALRGLALSATALAGVRITIEPGLARKRNNDRNEPKRRVCHCGRNNPQRVGCKTKRLPKDKVKQHLKRHKDDSRAGASRHRRQTRTRLPESATCTVDAQCCAGGICHSRGVGQPRRGYLCCLPNSARRLRSRCWKRVLCGHDLSRFRVQRG